MSELKLCPPPLQLFHASFSHRSRPTCGTRVRRQQPAAHHLENWTWPSNMLRRGAQSTAQRSDLQACHKRVKPRRPKFVLEPCERRNPSDVPRQRQERQWRAHRVKGQESRTTNSSETRAPTRRFGAMSRGYPSAASIPRAHSSTQTTLKRVTEVGPRQRQGGPHLHTDYTRNVL